MSHTTPHYIYLKDGSLCNLNKRIAQTDVSLLAHLRKIPDPRNNQGKRHELSLILFIVFVAILRGSRTLKDAHLWARYNQPFLERYFVLAHGIPDPTTLSNVLAVIDPDELVTGFLNFLAKLRIEPGNVYSFDGKTIRALPEDGTIRHILSLFSHELHTIVGQVGVEGKGKEIPAFETLLTQGIANKVIAGSLLLGDALHTQKATCKAILRANADYLFTVKNNQRQLKRAIADELGQHQADDPASWDAYAYTDKTRGRNVTTTVTLVAAQGEAVELLPTLTGSNHWDGVVTMGVLRRTGTRTSKDGTIHAIDETIGFIASRRLSAREVATHLHHHWCIENNLHWVKDEVFGEDKHTLRNGNAPQVMSFLRSMAIPKIHTFPNADFLRYTFAENSRKQICSTNLLQLSVKTS
jgi:predicted transposase YbfD/YdcC